MTPASPGGAARRRAAWALVLALALAHHDFWLWSERGLVAGFLPVGLAYHAGLSLAAAAVWALVLRWAWPAELERWAGESAPEA